MTGATPGATRRQVVREAQDVFPVPRITPPGARRQTRRALAISLLALALPVSAFAKLTIREEPADADVFGGEPATLTVFVANQKGPTVGARLCTRFYRFNMERRWPAGGTRPWKKLTVLADQTVLEKISITLPSAAASERYRVEILDESGVVLGGVNVQAWPRKMLSELTDLNGGSPVGVFDSLGKFRKCCKRTGFPSPT